MGFAGFGGFGGFATGDFGAGGLGFGGAFAFGVEAAASSPYSFRGNVLKDVPLTAQQGLARS